MKLLKLSLKAFIVAAIFLLIGYGTSPYNLRSMLNKFNLYRNNISAIKTSGKVSSTPYKINATKNVQLNDPYYDKQWNIRITSSNGAWSLINQKREVKVAVVDTGVDYNHPDLKNRVLTDLGYNFLQNNHNFMDDNWHGTHVSGIIAAQANNNIGITGVVGPLDIKIIPIKVLDKNGQGPSDIIAKGIEYAADVGADIINLSVNFDGKDEYISNAISYAKNKGVFVVVSSGNDNINCDKQSPTGDDGAFTVSAMNRELKRAYFSNYGSVVKLTAPGIEILSTIPGKKYGLKDGTSMAAPIVTGIAAMLKAENPSLKPQEIGGILQDTAVDILTKGRDMQSGYGLVNAKRAVLELKSIENAR